MRGKGPTQTAHARFITVRSQSFATTYNDDVFPLMICRRPAEFAFLRKISNLKRSDSEPGQLKCAIERPFGLSRYLTTANP